MTRCFDCYQGQIIGTPSDVIKKRQIKLFEASVSTTQHLVSNRNPPNSSPDLRLGLYLIPQLLILD